MPDFPGTGASREKQNLQEYNKARKENPAQATIIITQ